MNPVQQPPPGPGKPAPQRQTRHRVLAALLVWLGLQAGSAWADIWGYVDATGNPHFSPVKVDERYELFLRDRNEPEPYRVQRRVGGLASPESLMAAPADAEAAPIPNRMVGFVEASPGYRSVRHLLREASVKHGIDYALLQALIATESGFDSRAVSPKGAVGLMQLIPPTAERYGVRAGKETIEQRLTDPVVNIRAGARYLSDLIRMFPGQIELALAAYNAGEGAVQRAGNKIPNYPETKNYVKNVMLLYGHLKPPVTVVAPPMSPTPNRVRIEMKGSMAAPAPLPALRTGVPTAQN